MMTEEEKLEFYKSEYQGAAFAEFVGFRCTTLLLTWLEDQARIEARDRSEIIRRLLTKAAKEEGFNKHSIWNQRKRIKQ